MKTLAIFFSFDNNYVKPAAVAFWSLLDRAAKEVAYDMYVLHHDITEENKELLRDIVARNGRAKLSFIDTGDFLRSEWADGNWEGHQKRTQFTSDTVIRCFAARFFPQFDTIVYSDVDVVFTDDISELWDYDLSQVYIAGVRNAFMKYGEYELSHLKKEHYDMLKDSYLAGGIWVLNLKKIREDGIEEKMLDVIRDDTIVKRWNDQDVINIACGGRVAFLPLNYISYPYLLDFIRRPDFVSHFSRDELFDSYIHPKIIHYALNKPWKDDADRQDIWWAIHDYLSLSPSPIARVETRKILVKKLNKVKRRYKRTIVLAIVLGILLVLVVCIASAS